MNPTKRWRSQKVVGVCVLFGTATVSQHSFANPGDGDSTTINSLFWLGSTTDTNWFTNTNWFAGQTFGLPTAFSMLPAFYADSKLTVNGNPEGYIVPSGPAVMGYDFTGPPFPWQRRLTPRSP